MLTTALLVLGFFVILIFDNRPMIGAVLAGLLVIVWMLVQKIKVLKESTTSIEKSLATLTAVITKMEKAELSESMWQTKIVRKDADDTHVIKEDVPPPEKVDVITSSMHEDGPVAMQSSQTYSLAKELNNRTVPVIPEKSSKNDDVPNVVVSKAAPSTSTPSISIPPKGPSIIEKLLMFAWSWITDGNVFVRAGIIVLFMGMTFLIRYAIGENLIPIELRLAAVSAVAIALMYWGWCQRESRKTFSLVVQGGGVGLFYLTIFAGFSLYHVIPSGAAFVLLALTVALAAMLAVYQDAKSLALFATVGGFLAPVLTSSGSNNYIGLFSYYAILNLGIFTIAWFRSWKILNLVGFLFTFVISTTWGVLSYKAEYFSTTEPFLILFFLLYIGIGILYARDQAEFYKNYVDSTLIFGTPLLAFGLQCAMVKDYEYGIAISAFSLAFFYILLTNYLWKKYADSLRLLSESFLSLGVVFATLAIPFAIDGTLTGATWAIEGAGILWISIIQQQKYRRLFGVTLIFAAGLMLATELLLSRAIFNYAFANSVFIGCLIIALAASCGSWLLSRDYEGKLELERSLSTALLVYGLFVLFSGFEYQIKDFALYQVHGVLLVGLSGLCVLCYTVAGDRLKWDRAHWISLISVVPMGFAAAICYAYQPQLSEHYGYIIWAVSLLLYFYGLRRSIDVVDKKPLLMAHIFVAVIVVCLLLWDGLWQLLLSFSLLAVVFNHLSTKLSWPQLKVIALGFLPVLVICSTGAIVVDDNLIDLSSIASDITWSFPPGYILWPFGFVVYFYLLRQNPRIGEYATSNMHYAGAALIYALLLWLGPWPLLLGASLLSLLCNVLWRYYSWHEMYLTSIALLPLMLLTAFVNLLDNGFHTFYLQDYNLNLQFGMELGYALWPIAFACLFWIYKQYDNQERSAPPVLQSLSIMLPVFLLTGEASWHILDLVGVMNAWHMAWLPLMALLAIAIIMKIDCWPFKQHRGSYYQLALPIISLVPIVWSFLQLLSSGDSMPLPWMPLLNPIDIVQAIIVIGILLWMSDILSAYKWQPAKQTIIHVLIAYMFLWMNIDLLRAVYHWADIRWQIPDIMSANISQTVLSLFWALCGLLTTLYSSRRKKRTYWLIGAALLGVVVCKLFLIDLSARETIERIVSFTGVGILLMLVGYFSPLPPKKIIKIEGV